MRLNLLMVLLMALVLSSASCRNEKNILVTNLPPFPKTVLAEIEQFRLEIGAPGLEVPNVFEPQGWNVSLTGRRLLALLALGIDNRQLNPAQTELINNLADYLTIFFLDPDENNFVLPSAALALTGILYTIPEELNPYYRYGLSRMWYSFKAMDDPPSMLKDLVDYVAQCALSKGLPLIEGFLEYYKSRTGLPLEEAYSFTMAGSESVFLQGFNLPGQFGNPLRKALSENDLAKARQSVALYYRYKFSKLEQLRRSKQVDLIEAEDLLENIFILRAHMERRHEFGPTVDWTTVLDDDIESNVSLNHHSHLLLLARAWRQTGDLRFRDHLMELMLGWLAQSPRPNIHPWRLQWRSLEVGGRASHTWPKIMALGADDSIFVAKLFYPMIKSLYQHADFLVSFGMTRPNNWCQVETSGLMSAALLLSEHRDAEDFRCIALRRFKYLNQELYFPDGLQTENSIYYHMFPLSRQLEAFRIARSLGIVLDTSWTAVLERGIEALVISAQPDGSIPAVSDVGPRKVYIHQMQQEGRELFPANPLFHYPMGFEHAGSAEPPLVTSYRFPYAGYGIMRQDWTPQSQYMLFDMGFFGTNHQHEDKLNIILYAYGRELLHDPGIYRYSDDGFGRYYRGSRGHNLVLVDGKTHLWKVFYDKVDPFKGVSFPDPDSRWLDRPTHILAQGAYRRGFAEKLHTIKPHDDERATLVAVEHERKILWVKDEYWVMVDYLIGEGSHKLEQIFHFSPLLKSHSAEGVDPGNVILIGNNGVVSRNPGVANIAVMQVGGNDLLARKQKGTRNPHVGWTSLYGEIPAWDVTFETNRQLPTALATVLFPLKPCESSLPELRTIRQDSLAVVFDLVFTSHTDRIVLTCSREVTQVDFKDGLFEGEALLLRMADGKEFVPLLHEGGRSLVLNGRQVPLPENPQLPASWN
jgi:hypothetical protein